MMPLTLSTVTAATSEPLLLQEAKDHCRVDGVEQDTVIAGLVAAARDYVENFTHRQLMQATLKLSLDAFPDYCSPSAWNTQYFAPSLERVNHGGTIIVPRAPLVSVSSITYVDTAGATQTLSASNYQVDVLSEPGRIMPAYGYSWPSTREQLNAVSVTYVAGYSAASAIPPALKQAMLLLIGHWYENREAVLTGGTSKEIEFAVQSLLWQQRVFQSGAIF